MNVVIALLAMLVPIVVFGEIPKSSSDHSTEIVTIDSDLKNVILDFTGTKSIIGLKSLNYSKTSRFEALFVSVELKRKGSGGIQESVMHAGLFIVKDMFKGRMRFRVVDDSFRLDTGNAHDGIKSQFDILSHLEPEALDTIPYSKTIMSE